MLPLTYLFKFILCSAAFFGYYLIALRNRRIHQYNRFYLLFSVAASWLIPLMKYEIDTVQNVQQPIYQAFTYITESSAEFEFDPAQKVSSSFNWIQLLPIIYFLVSGILLSALIYSLYKIYRIHNKYPKQKIGNMVFLNTSESGTPFSFFKYIFWNNEIDASSITGRQIFEHELTHVKQKHSWDKLFIQLNLVVGWINPFFWLIKKELGMIHEFIADNKAITDSNPSDLASMLLAAAFPAPKYRLINPFYFSPIKRRLTMLTQNKNLRFSFLRKLIVLPLLAIVVLLSAFRQKENSFAGDDFLPAYKIMQNTTLAKKYKVVIDAGHGGTDIGCKSIDATVFEKDVNLAIVKAIKKLNNNKNIEIVLTRDDDHFDDVKAKAEFINNQKADLCISIHCSNVGENDQLSGTEIFVISPEKRNNFIYESHALAQSVNGVLKMNFDNRGIKTNKQGIYLLQATQCPTILIEAGVLSNQKDASMLMQTKKQELIANNILKGIENYLALKEMR